MSEDRPGPERKKRLQNACDECRRRKIRCDSETMPNNECSQCLNLGIQCTHFKMQQKRGPKPGSLRTAASQPVNVLVTNILRGTNSDPFVIPEDQEITRKILVKLANRIQNLERELKQFRDAHSALVSRGNSSPSHSNSTSGYSPPSQDASSPESAENSEDIDGVDDLSNELSQFSFGVPENNHFGEASNIMLVMAALDHKKELHGTNSPEWKSIFSHVKRAEFWQLSPTLSLPASSQPQEPSPPFEFPPSPLLYQLIDAYFVEHDIYSPLLHRPSFERSVAEGLHLRDSSFGALVLVVCAHGAWFLSPNPVRDKAGDKWFNQIQLEKFVFNQPLHIYHLQLYCLCSFYFHSIAKSMDTAWLLAGIAIRRAQAKGAHRRYSHDSQPTTEGELWKRAFWMLMVIDTRMSTLFGRPRATSIQDFDLGPLTECDDEYWEPKDPKQAFIQPLGKPSTVSFWNSYMRLTEIYGFALLTIYSVRKSELGTKMGMGNNIEWYEKAVRELDSALNKWVDSVQEHLQWENAQKHPIFFGQAAILYSYYFFIQIQVHRRFIPRPGQSSDVLSYPSLAICTNAARSCLSVCETYLKERFLQYPHFFVPLFNSAMVLALNLARSTQLRLNFDPAKEVEDIYKCTGLLRIYEPKYAIAGRMIDAINMVMYASNYPQLTSSPPPALSPSYTSESRNNMRFQAESGENQQSDASQTSNTTMIRQGEDQSQSHRPTSTIIATPNTTITGAHDMDPQNLQDHRWSAPNHSNDTASSSTAMVGGGGRSSMGIQPFSVSVGESETHAHRQAPTHHVNLPFYTSELGGRPIHGISSNAFDNTQSQSQFSSPQYSHLLPQSNPRLSEAPAHPSTHSPSVNTNPNATLNIFNVTAIDIPGMSSEMREYFSLFDDRIGDVSMMGEIGAGGNYTPYHHDPNLKQDMWRTQPDYASQPQSQTPTQEWNSYIGVTGMDPMTAAAGHTPTAIHTHSQHYGSYRY